MAKVKFVKDFTRSILKYFTPKTPLQLVDIERRIYKTQSNIYDKAFLRK